MAETLHVELRDTRGKRNARRQRRSGGIPAVLYGHGQEALSLSLSGEEIDAALRHGARLVNLVGAVTDQAFVRQMQWDTWGTHLLHVDLTRISAHEKVRIQVPLELRGEAPGVKEGGIIEQLLHEIQVECEVSAIPERLAVKINQLKLGEAIKVADLSLPDLVVAMADKDAVVVQCVMPAEVPEEVTVAAGEAEPEVIGRKKEEEEEEEE